MSSRFPNPVDVFVVGGGPAGLATAIAARHQGLSVAVADGAIPPIDKPCGEGLMPDGVEALSHLGVAIPEGEAHPFRGIRFVNGDQEAQACFPGHCGYGVRRTTLHRVMVDHAEAAGVSLLWQTSVSGIAPEGVMIGGTMGRASGELVRSRWIVGADGTGSRVRQWAGLGGQGRNSLRFAFRRHYRVAPWTDCMELYWGKGCQIYVTPVGNAEVCVALISDRTISSGAMSSRTIPDYQQRRIDDVLAEFPQLSARLHGAEYSSSERGAITFSRKLRHVYRGRVVLVGDASAGVDAITGEGLCLAFRQSALLAESLASGDLSRYQVEHRKLIRRPALMARLMLLMGGHPRLRRRTMRVFQSSQRCFAGMLRMHVGAGTTQDYVASGVSLGWNLLKA